MSAPTDSSELHPFQAETPGAPDARYQTLFNSILYGIILRDAEGIILAANPAAERILGLSQQQMRGHTTLDPWWRFIREDGSPFPGEEHPAMVALRTGRPVEDVVMGVFNPERGTTRWAHVSATPLQAPGEGHPYQVMSSFQDITDRKRAEDALRDSQARLHRAESVAHFGNWELNLDDGTMRGSEGANLIYGVQGHAWSLSLAQSIPLPEYRAMLDAALADLIHHRRPYNVEFRIRRPHDGLLRSIHSIAEYDPARHTVFGVIHDITEHRAMEEEKANLQAQLQQAQKMDSLGSLAGGIAHDMNNVLGVILSLASAHLDSQSEDSPVHRAFETIARAATRGGKMIQSLLSFARQSPAEERDLDLDTILRDEVGLLERTTLSRIRLDLDLAGDLGAVHGDGNALAQAFLNLCVNAVDAMPQGGTLTLRTRNLGTDWIQVVVEDTGIGMPEEVLRKAMDPFFTTKEVGKGTGLGLSVVYSVVKAHGGQLEIQSEPGRGTRVEMRFPVSRHRAPESEAAAAPAQESSHRALSVLLVDDDDLVQSSTRTLLEVLGHRVLAVSSGEEALAALEAGHLPDLVILDMNMPGLGGAGTLPRLQALRPTLPVLLATGRVDQVATRLVETHRHVTLLPKPYAMDELKRHLGLLTQR